MERGEDNQLLRSVVRWLHLQLLTVFNIAGSFVRRLPRSTS